MVFKKYIRLFNDQSEKKYLDSLQLIREDVAVQLKELKDYYNGMFDSQHAEHQEELIKHKKANQRYDEIYSTCMQQTTVEHLNRAN